MREARRARTESEAISSTPTDAYCAIGAVAPNGVNESFVADGRTQSGRIFQNQYDNRELRIVRRILLWRESEGPSTKRVTRSRVSETRELLFTDLLPVTIRVASMALALWSNEGRPELASESDQQLWPHSESFP